MKKDIETILNKRGFTKENLSKALGVDEEIIDQIINDQVTDEKLLATIKPKIFYLANGFGFEVPKDRLEVIVEELKNKYGISQEQLCFYADVGEAEFNKFMNNQLIDRDSKVRIYSYLAALYYVLK